MAFVALITAGLAGLAVGVVTAFLLFRRLGRERRRPAAALARTTTPGGAMVAKTLLELLPTGAVLVDRSGEVVLANPAARDMGVVVGDVVAATELRQLVRGARREGVPRELELSLSLPGELPRRTLAVRGRAEPLANGSVALVVDDVTEARRVDAVRRDFVANVGHEIKTPVGAMAVLVEAALDARDDPAAVDRFLGRLQHEVHRLSRLVQELIDLSRVQGGEPLPDPEVVAVDAVVEEAVDRVRLGADAKDIAVVVADDPEAFVAGSEGQLVTAVVNLLQNAVAYSPGATRVVVAVRRQGSTVELSVTDQGIGIAPEDVDRVFERFYRVDPARSRATGGTGLGLAIVKHIVTNHGGEVSVWSSPGAGSTFTVRLPALVVRPGAAMGLRTAASSRAGTVEEV